MQACHIRIFLLNLAWIFRENLMTESSKRWELVTWWSGFTIYLGEGGGGVIKWVAMKYNCRQTHFSAAIPAVGVCLGSVSAFQLSDSWFTESQESWAEQQSAAVNHSHTHVYIDIEQPRTSIPGTCCNDASMQQVCEAETQLGWAWNEDRGAFYRRISRVRRRYESFHLLFITLRFDETSLPPYGDVIKGKLR